MKQTKQFILLFIFIFTFNGSKLLANSNTEEFSSSIYLLDQCYHHPFINRVITSPLTKPDALFPLPLFQTQFKIEAPSANGVLEFSCKLKENTAYPGNLYATLTLTNGKTHRYKINVSSNQINFAFPQSFESAPISKINISGESLEYVISFQCHKNINSLNPIPADFYQIHNYPTEAMRNQQYEFFSWSLLPQFIVFRFNNYYIQTKFLKRIAFFTEKEGYVGQILSNSQLKNKHGWNAHDYCAKDLAAFFQLAEQKQCQLNKEEILLKQILLNHKIILKNENGYTEGRGGIVSFAIDSKASKYVQHLFLTHEGLHAIFFSEAPIRNLTKTRWQELEPPVKRLWQLFFKYKEYDSTNQFLTENEFFAYTLTRPAQNMRSYFFNDNIPILKRQFPKERKFLNTLSLISTDFLSRESQILEKAVQQKYPIEAGDLRTLIPIY